MVYEPLHHKYRPQTFADLVGQEAISTTLINAIRQQRIAPAYLLTGPRGTGKTSSARILAKSLNCLSQPNPTESPCGHCEACKTIARGDALDVIEIDAASNTGVDNIRDLIEKAQFAPVQCRYKVYVIDECLTGDTLIQTRKGFMRLDNEAILGQDVLSYNEVSQKWEYRKVLRWLERGEKPTLLIQTNQGFIQCTENHLIGTEQGWIKAGNVKEGMKILSPVTAAVVHQFTSTVQMATIESVSLAGTQNVYDIEVEGNHNFVANGLLVHNCHMLSTAAFNALLKTLEEPPDRIVFVLATTDPQRVLPTIISRCQRFDFRRIPLEAMVQHLSTIAAKEKIDIVNPAITLVAQLSQGGLRDAESLLDQLSLLPPPVTPESGWDLVGAVPERDLLGLVQAIATDQPETVIDRARHLMNRGREPLIVLQNLASFYRDLLIAKTAPQRQDMVAITDETWQEVCALAQTLAISAILQGQQHLRSSEGQIKNTTQPRLWLEVTLMGLLPSALIPTAPSPQPLAASFVPAPTARSVLPTTIAPVTPVAVSPPSIAAVESSGLSPELPPHSVADQRTSSPITSPQSPTPVDNLSASADSVAHTDHSALWERTLARTNVASAKALFGQQAQLLALMGKQAIVGVRPSLLKLAESKIPPIQEALSQVLGYPVTVKLQPLNPSENPSSPSSPLNPSTFSTPSNPPIASLPPEVQSRPQPLPAPAIDPSSATPPIPPSSPSLQPKSPPKSAPKPEPSAFPQATSQLTPQLTPQATSQNTSQTTAKPLSQIWNEDETLRAAKSLATFFNGDVIVEEEELGDPIDPMPTTIALEDSVDDDDVPF